MSTEENHSQGKPDQGGHDQESDLSQTDELKLQESEAEGAPDAASELAKLQEELIAAKDQSLRTQAEMQNLRRRSEREVENAHKYALEKFVGESLKVLTEGVELTLKSFQDVLVRYKVEPVDPKGQPFDPEFHQAMSMLEMPEEVPNTVVDVFQKGYTLNGRLVRPAMVVVAKAAAS